MRSVQLQDSTTELAEYVSDAERGETVTILRGDRPVAQIIPFPQPVSVRSQQDREESLRRLDEMMRRGFPMEGFRIENRDELYDRD